MALDLSQDRKWWIKLFHSLFVSQRAEASTIQELPAMKVITT